MLMSNGQEYHCETHQSSIGSFAVTSQKALLSCSDPQELRRTSEEKTIMNQNIGNRRKPRPPAGRRTRGSIDKAIINDGVYGNIRLVHTTTSLVGCSVQVSVKNGGLYEGFLNTISPKATVVLDTAHRVESGSQGSIPSRERLMSSVILNLNDIVTISATNVDLEYANKDTFTDSAISRHNGQTGEKELQPWEADNSGDGSLETLEPSAAGPVMPGNNLSSGSANGWDADDMFNTNASKFDVKSTYDPNLTDYTTPLVKKDTKEYREREAMATRMAQEIEGCDEHRMRIDLENGDVDEEMAFSAVHRPEANNNGTNGGAKKSAAPPSQSRPVRPAGPPGKNLQASQRHYHQPSPNRSPGAQGPMGPPLGAVGGPGQNARAVCPAGQPPPAAGGPVPAVPPAPYDEQQENKPHERRGDGQPHIPTSTQAVNPSDQGNTDSNQLQSKLDQNKRTQKERCQLQELRDFGESFKLSDNDPKDREKKGSQVGGVAAGPHPAIVQPPINAPQQQQQQQQPPVQHMGPPRPMAPNQGPMSGVVPSAQQQGDQKPGQPPVVASASAVGPEKATSVSAGPVTGLGGEKKEEADKKDSSFSEKDKKAASNLNPFAKEFVPSAKAFVPRAQPMQVPTPPRPSTQQSPVMVPMYPYSVVPGQMQNQVAASMAVQNAQPQRMAAKRVTVSAQRPEFNPASQAAAVTGHPLLAQTSMPPAQQQQAYLSPYNMPIMAGGIPQGYQQMIQLPGSQTRLVVLPGAEQSQQQQQQQQNQGQTHQMAVQPNPGQHMFMSGPPMNQMHMGPAGANQPSSHAMASHMAPHHQATPPHSQPGHAGNPAAASPVQQHSMGPPMGGPPHGGGGPPHGGPAAGGGGGQPGGQPPPSGTPQPHGVMYAAGGAGAGGQHGAQPPLQPSPHTQPSPQMYPAYSAYSFVSQQSAPATMPSYSHPHQHTMVTQAQHAHSHMPQQFMMMPAPGSHGMPQGQVPGGPSAAGGSHPQYPAAGHHIPSHQLPGGPSMPGQAGPAQLPFPHAQIASQAPPQPIPAYSHNQ